MPSKLLSKTSVAVLEEGLHCRPVVKEVAARLMVAGNGSEEDIQRAQSVIGAGELLVAVWRPTAEEATKAACLPYSPILYFPCFLPHFVACSPFLLACFISNRQQLEDSLTVLTDKKLYRDVLPPCCAGANTGSNGSVRLSEIISVNENLPDGTWSAPCCDGLNVVTLTLPSGHDIANAGGGKHRPANKLQFLCDNPVTTRQLIEAGIDSATSNVNHAAVNINISPGMAHMEPVQQVATRA